MQPPFLHHIYAPKISKFGIFRWGKVKVVGECTESTSESMAVPKAAFEVPESKRWLENFDWEDSNSNTKENNMMDKNFINSVTKEETDKFESSISQCNDLNNDALQALNDIHVDKFLGKKS